MIRINGMDEVSSVFGRIEGCRGSVWLVASVPDKKALSRSELFNLGLDQGQICETCRVSVELPILKRWIAILCRMSYMTPKPSRSASSKYS
jgi:hypothetical protein